MSALLTVDELRQRVESLADDASLADVIAAEESVIVERFGPHQIMVETIDMARLGFNVLGGHHPVKRITLQRPAVTITSLVERVGDVETTLAADDYAILNRYQIERLPNGTNSRLSWGDRLVVTYTPVDDQLLRKQVLITLCLLALSENGYLIEKTPEFTLQSIEDIPAARAAALRRLQKGLIWA